MRELFQHYLYLLGPLSFAVQIGLCVHAYKTGRPFWWMWILFIAPFIGSLLYVVLEIIPDARSSGRHGIKTSWFIPRSVMIKRQREELEEGETITRRLKLASLLFEDSRKQEAEAEATMAASGVFKGDPAVVSEVAWYMIENGHYDEAQRLIGGIDSKPDKLTKTYIELLKARICHGRKDHVGALTLLEGITDNSLGEERRYMIACCHLGLGDQQKAVSLLEDITKSYRKGGAIWRRAEKKWYKASTTLLKEVRIKQKIA